jgi:site-specific DNA recombinase
MKRAILLARTSYDDRDTDGRNLQGQLDECREYALGKGYVVVAELAEDVRGVSGAILYTPKLAEALDAVRDDQADVLVLREMDRFARGLAKQLIVEQEFKQAGAEIDYVLGDYPDTPEGNLLKNVRAVIAEYERLKVVERTQRGKRLKVEAGSVMVLGNSPYGYRAVKENDKTMLVVREDEAQVVRDIFRWYLSGDRDGSGPMSLRGIARKLNKAGVPTYNEARGKRRKRGGWEQSSVRRILRNETYAGVWRYGKVSSKDWDGLPTVAVPAIVSREMWEMAQRRLDENRRTRRREPKYPYLLRRRAWCGCGLKMCTYTVTSGGKLYRYYGCSSLNRPNPDGYECDAPSFNADHVDAGVWEWVKSFLSSPEAMLEALEAQRSLRDEEQQALERRLEDIERQIAGHQAQLERAAKIYLTGGRLADVLTREAAGLEAAMDSLERERAALMAELAAQIIAEEQVPALREFAAEVAARLEAAEEDFETRQRIIEILDVGVTLTVEEGQKVAYPRCALGGDLPLLCTSTGTRLSRSRWARAAPPAHRAARPPPARTC